MLRAGGLEEAEALRTFNCGIGMVAVVEPQAADALTEGLSAAGETVVPIGRVIEGAGVTYRGRLA